MKIYIRDFQSFTALAMYEADTYTIHLDQMQNSTFTVAAEIYEQEGNLLCVYETEPAFVGLISATTVKDGKTTIQVEPFLKVFDREIELVDSVSSYAQKGVGFILYNVNQYWISASDSYFKTQWLTRGGSTTSTSEEDPETNDAGLFNLYEYIKRQIEADDIQVKITPSNTGVAMVVKAKDSTAEIYDLTTGRHQLISEANSASVASKISTHIKAEGSSTYTETIYYLFDDGSFGTDPTAGTRVKGKWKRLINPKEDTSVADEFAKNEYKREVNFYGENIPIDGYFDHHRVKIKLENGRIIETVITEISYTNADKRYNIKTGSVCSSLKSYLETAFITSQKALKKVNGQ